ncbi:MAG TPA: two-component system sensor histidine kinase CreC [Oligoflexus sp.]|uniref:two-component system sensor histidine kinase CreC n=1 Tax=Oligoflexus sp. TaxID=1971216 RepID=UPI002D8030BE|nr:two-component system sensor histidine kinase CreC [Oligoflexus sp.]HET9237374.1 two-component system sensor histidine kinase CreC [Oligoflexus sp.]
MRLGFGIFLGYFLIAILAGYFVLNVFVDEIKPSARQSMEDSLVDAANLLAELAVDDMVENRLAAGDFSKRVAAYQARQLDASIWGFSRKRPGFRIYITDAKGIVQYDSAHEDLGRDYSQWNDVYLTLKGQYGVRSSPAKALGESGSTIMHVAAPIKLDNKVIGVLTIAKSNLAVEPFIQRTQRKIETAGYWLLGASLLIGVLISLWLSASLQKLVAYAEAVTRGERVVLPALSLTEIKRLGLSLQSMRERLEGKRYIEEYTMTLTHEMKSPLTAIQAASELLQEPMPEEQKQKFLSSISDQARRLHVLIEKMLQQASLETRQTLENAERVNLSAVIKRALDGFGPKLEKKLLKLHVSIPDQAMVQGDPFLLEQVMLNLIENAADFSPRGGALGLTLERKDQVWSVCLRDHGSGIPDYAMGRVFERYYSLPRPEGGAKSTGLGLTFVKKVMDLHGGRVTLDNHPEGGAEARLDIPASL